LPNIALDGELWIDRKKFQRTVSIVRRQDKTDLWNEVRYLVFDAPTAPGGFEERLSVVQSTLLDHQSKFARPHEHELCKDIASLRAELSRVEALGGEGLMLRQPGSRYEVGRSATLLKVKSFRDAEATVIAHQGGAGKHKGRLGALVVRLPDGTEFSVGTGFSDRERTNPPAVGATVTFRYQELSEGGVPRFPSYVGLRLDAPPAPVAKLTAKIDESKQEEVVMTRSNPSDTPPTDSAKRHFEYTDDKSNKFWEVSRSGPNMTTHWGRIGTAGQSKTKTFPDDATAAKQVAKLIEEKTGEGYVEKT
jgi:DNA ligase-1